MANRFEGGEPKILSSEDQDMVDAAYEDAMKNQKPKEEKELFPGHDKALKTANKAIEGDERKKAQEAEASKEDNEIIHPGVQRDDVIMSGDKKLGVVTDIELDSLIDGGGQIRIKRDDDVMDFITFKDFNDKRFNNDDADKISIVRDAK